MKRRMGVVALALIAVPLSLPAAAPAQTGQRKVIRINATSYRFEPNLIQVNQGDTVVLQLTNVDTAERHSIWARFLTQFAVTVRGDVSRRGAFGEYGFVEVNPGRQAEIEFVANTRGTFPFVCGTSDHAWRGQTGALNVLLPASP